MKFYKATFLFSLISSIMVSSSVAGNGTFNFKGEVTNSGCVIEEPNLIVEGFKNLARWTIPEQGAYFSGPIASIVNIDCGVITNVPKIRFSAETGKVVGKRYTYLKTTGTASNIGFWIATENKALAYDDTLFTLLKAEPSTSGKYFFALNHRVFGLSPYDESNNGDFEAVLGYELVYN